MMIAASSKKIQNLSVVRQILKHSTFTCLVQGYGTGKQKQIELAHCWVPNECQFRKGCNMYWITIESWNHNEIQLNSLDFSRWGRWTERKHQGHETLLLNKGLMLGWVYGSNDFSTFLFCLNHLRKCVWDCNILYKSGFQKFLDVLSNWI